MTLLNVSPDDREWVISCGWIHSAVTCLQPHLHHSPYPSPSSWLPS